MHKPGKYFAFPKKPIKRQRFNQNVCILRAFQSNFNADVQEAYQETHLLNDIYLIYKKITNSLIIIITTTIAQEQHSNNFQ